MQDDEVIELSQSDVLRVAPAVARSVEGGPDGLEVICIGGRKPEGPDNVRVDDFVHIVARVGECKLKRWL